MEGLEQVNSYSVRTLPHDAVMPPTFWSCWLNRYESTSRCPTDNFYNSCAALKWTKLSSAWQNQAMGTGREVVLCGVSVCLQRVWGARRVSRKALTPPFRRGKEGRSQMGGPCSGLAHTTSVHNTSAQTWQALLLSPFIEGATGVLVRSCPWARDPTTFGRGGRFDLWGPLHNFQEGLRKTGLPSPGAAHSEKCVVSLKQSWSIVKAEFKKKHFVLLKKTALFCNSVSSITKVLSKVSKYFPFRDIVIISKLLRNFSN